MEKQTEYVLYFLFPTFGILVIIGMCAFLFNCGRFPQLPGFYKADNAKWASIIVFAFQFWDFVSDLNLSLEIWRNGSLLDDTLILMLAIVSSFFILVAYIVNLVMALNIKNIIKHNNVIAKSWFHDRYNTSIFILLVIFTGDAYAALALVSSGIFGLNIMTSGLTQHELSSKMGKMNVIVTIVLKNIPQLLCQTLYVYALGYISDGVILAFTSSISSMLSMTCSALSLCINHYDTNIKVTEYYLLTQCGERVKKSTNTNDDDQKRTTDYITTQEKQNFLDNRCLTSRLGESIAEIFGIAPKNIQIGSSMLTKYGIMTYVVHYIYQADLEMMEYEIKDGDNTNNNQVAITPTYYASELYTSLKSEMNSVFRNHFNINNDFDVVFSKDNDDAESIALSLSRWEKKDDDHLDDKSISEDSNAKENQISNIFTHIQQSITL